ncbi:MAG: hypothetical protein AAF405_08310, partial [Pseudomonadota bacterium]
RMLSYLSGWFSVREVKKNLKVISKLDADVRASYAKDLWKQKLLFMSLDAGGFEELPVDETLKHELIRHSLINAIQNRREAYALGARSNADLCWNYAATIESWCTTKFGHLNGRMSKTPLLRIEKMLREFIDDNLGGDCKDAGVREFAETLKHQINEAKQRRWRGPI